MISGVVLPDLRSATSTTVLVLAYKYQQNAGSLCL